MMSLHNDKVAIGLVGGSIRGLIAECVQASHNDGRWQVIELDADNVKLDKKKPLSLILKAFEMGKGIWLMRHADIVIVVFVSRLALIYTKAARLFKKKIVYYWLGSDVQEAVQNPAQGRKLHDADLHLSYSEGNISELASIGINAKLLVTPTRLSNDLADMPEKHAVLLSIPDARKEFYGYDDLMRLVDKFPELQFHIIRSEHPEYYDKANIEFEGMLDRDQMDELFNHVSISVRWPEHDGTSLILMESALKGKYIISRNPFPCGVVVNSFESLCSVLSKIIETSPAPCMKNRNYALEHFTQAEAGRKLIAYLEELAG